MTTDSRQASVLVPLTSNNAKDIGPADTNTAPVLGSLENLEKVKLQQPSKTRQTTPLSPLSERQNPRSKNQKPHSRSGSRSVSKDKNGKKLPPGKAAIKKLAGLRVDPSLPRDQ